MEKSLIYKLKQKFWATKLALGGDVGSMLSFSDVFCDHPKAPTLALIWRNHMTNDKLLRINKRTQSFHGQQLAGDGLWKPTLLIKGDGPATVLGVCIRL